MSCGHRWPSRLSERKILRHARDENSCTRPLGEFAGIVGLAPGDHDAILTREGGEHDYTGVAPGSARGLGGGVIRRELTLPSWPALETL